MNVNDSQGESRSLTHRPAIARRQLHASVGAIVVVALIAVLAAVSLREGASNANQTAAHAPRMPTIVKAAVREKPSQRMQATDQTRSDRGS